MLNLLLVLVQGWSCFTPSFDGVAFVSYYIELPIMLIMFVGWKVWNRTSIVRLNDMDLESDVYEVHSGDIDNNLGPEWRSNMQTIIRLLF